MEWVWERVDGSSVRVVAPAAEHIDSSLNSVMLHASWHRGELVEQAFRVPSASRSGVNSTESLVRRYTVIVIITKAQQKERQHSSWRALAPG